MLLNLSQNVLSGNFLTASVANPTGLPTTAVTGVTLPVTTAWGVSSTAINETGLTPDHQSARPVTITVTLGAISGSIPAFTANWAIIAGPESSSPNRYT